MKVVGKIFAVLYTILFSVLLFAFSLGFLVSKAFTPTFYIDAFKSVELSEIKLSDLGIEEGDKTLEDMLSDTIIEMGLDKKVAKSIMENEEIKEVAGEVIGQIVNYSVKGGDVPTVNKTQVNKVLNNADVKKVIGSSISSSDIDELVKDINDALKEMCKEGGFSFGN